MHACSERYHNNLHIKNSTTLYIVITGTLRSFDWKIYVLRWHATEQGSVEQSSCHVVLPWKYRWALFVDEAHEQSVALHVFAGFANFTQAPVKESPGNTTRPWSMEDPNYQNKAKKIKNEYANKGTKLILNTCEYFISKMLINLKCVIYYFVLSNLLRSILRGYCISVNTSVHAILADETQLSL